MRLCPLLGSRGPALRRRCRVGSSWGRPWRAVSVGCSPGARGTERGRGGLKGQAAAPQVCSVPEGAQGPESTGWLSYQRQRDPAFTSRAPLQGRWCPAPGRGWDPGKACAATEEPSAARSLGTGAGRGNRGCDTCPRSRRPCRAPGGWSPRSQSSPPCPQPMDLPDSGREVNALKTVKGAQEGEVSRLARFCDPGT